MSYFQIINTLKKIVNFSIFFLLSSFFFTFLVKFLSKHVGTHSTVHNNLNRVIFSIDRLLDKMQFLQHDSCPKSTLRKIGRDCAFLEVNVETVSSQCLRRLTIPLKCHANAKAWVLVNDRTKEQCLKITQKV